jgi:segregation and condensation protein A
MEYKITINDFEGPLDLLLHLVKQSEIEIWDIKIEDITKQYLEYIKQMEQINLSIASEYLVMAAELIEMKSQMLLPNIKDEDNDEYEDDPRETLINRLLEYKKYKEISTKFKELEQERHQVYTKTPTDLREYADENTTVKLSEDIGLSDLLQAFAKFMDRKDLSKPLSTKITRREISVDERSKEIKSILSNKKSVKFIDLFDIINKEYIVVTFLAILEMAKKQEIIINQDNNFDNITLSLRGSE